MRPVCATLLAIFFAPALVVAAPPVTLVLQFDHGYSTESLAVMERDAARMRGPRPFVFTNVRAGQGVDTVVAFIEERGGLVRRA